MTATTNTVDRLPARQVRWTRLGAGMGYTNTDPKREAIRAAVARMGWTEPEQLRGVLDEPIIRFCLNGLFYGRAWALHRAGVESITDLPEHPGGAYRLVGLEAVTGERYLLLDLGYEAIDILHDHPAIEGVARR
jgi:hypothetical protein